MQQKKLSPQDKSLFCQIQKSQFCMKFIIRLNGGIVFSNTPDHAFIFLRTKPLLELVIQRQPEKFDRVVIFCIHTALSIVPGKINRCVLSLNISISHIKGQIIAILIIQTDRLPQPVRIRNTRRTVFFLDGRLIIGNTQA